MTLDSGIVVLYSLVFTCVQEGAANITWALRYCDDVSNNDLLPSSGSPDDLRVGWRKGRVLASTQVSSDGHISHSHREGRNGGK